MRIRVGNLLWSAVLLAASPLQGIPQSATGPNPDGLLRYEPAEQGPDHTVWNKVLAATDPSGASILRTNAAFTELASGLNRPAADGSWLRCTETVSPYADGAVAAGARHRAAFASQLTDAIRSMLYDDGACTCP